MGWAEMKGICLFTKNAFPPGAMTPNNPISLLWHHVIFFPLFSANYLKTIFKVNWYQFDPHSYIPEKFDAVYFFSTEQLYSFFFIFFERLNTV